MNDIFIEQDIKQNKLYKLYKKNIIKSIPNDALKEPDNILAKNKTEWRWRIFKFPHKNNETIEISYKNYKENDKYRFFVDKNGDWVKQEDLDKNFDQFLIDQYYIYAED